MLDGDGGFSTSGLGAEWHKKACTIAIGCSPSTVKVYDSLYSELPMEQICALLTSQEPVIDLIYVTVQRQQNGCDCGLFVLAYATALCSGQNPACLLFKQSVMRACLLKYLEEEDMKPLTF